MTRKRGRALRCLPAGVAVLIALACATSAPPPPQETAPPPRPLDATGREIATVADAQVVAEPDHVVVTFPADLLFVEGEADLLEGGAERLRGVAERITGWSEPILEVRVHSALDGSESVNLALCEQRAERARLYLVEQGLDPMRVTAQGLGGEFPVGDNETEDGRGRNRRVELVVRSPSLDATSVSTPTAAGH